MNSTSFHRPHGVHSKGTHPDHGNPVLANARVILAVKNFAAIQGVCHIGLGVTATNTLKVLRRNGVRAEAWATQTAEELKLKLRQAAKTGDVPISHVIVSAPSWVQPNEFMSLCVEWPEIVFIQLNHSGCAFLSIDKFGIKNIRACIEMRMSLHNMVVASNNPRVANWLSETFGFESLLLPNLYDCLSFVNPCPPKPIGSELRIGSFGAGRPWKNQLTAAEAAVELARRLGVNLKFYVNSKRPDGGERMIESRKELFAGLRGCELIEVPWEPWPQFRRTVSTMNVLFQPSFDETFNVVTADGIAEGVPSVTSSSIEWTPKNWWCQECDPGTIVDVAIQLLHDPAAVEKGRRQLRDYVSSGIRRWVNYLSHQEAPI